MFKWIRVERDADVLIWDLVDIEIPLAHELVTFQSNDHAEALRAIAERRPPTFEGG